MVKIFTSNENGKIELTEAQLNEILWDAFEEGVAKGRNEGKLEEKMRNLDARLEEEKKKKSNTINTYPWDTTPILTSPQPLPIYYTIDKDKEKDWSKVTCTGTPMPKQDCITTCANSSNNKYEFKANTPNVFDINAAKKEKKKNGRK